MTQIAYCLTTGAFDFGQFLCPLETAVELLKETDDYCDIEDLVLLSSKMELGELREAPRVLVLPQGETSYFIVLLIKVDHGGTCYWLSKDETPLIIIGNLMDYRDYISVVLEPDTENREITNG